MPDWAPWLIAAALLTGGELLTMGLFLGPLALAALVAAVVALAGSGIEPQLIAFIVASVASLGLLRPIAMRHLRTPAAVRTGAAALVGTRALVMERVYADGGSVKIGGEVWTARPYDDENVIEPGKRVEVLKIQGATALVAE